jgi:transketolase N-terminal domain/subunit
MFLLGFLTAAYLLVAVFALMMTYDEQQQQTENRGVVLKSLGFLACLFWPLAFVTAVLTSRTA